MIRAPYERLFFYPIPDEPKPKSDFCVQILAFCARISLDRHYRNALSMVACPYVRPSA